jgi:hypothetical protein
MSRFTWAIVAGVLALVVLSVGLAVALPRTQPEPDMGTPEGVALAYALAMQRGEPEDAWDLLAESARSQTTRDSFIARAGDVASSYERARLSVEDPRVTGDTARVQLVRTYPSSSGPFGLGGGSFSNRNTVTLIQASGGWRISTPPEAFLLVNRP